MSDKLKEYIDLYHDKKIFLPSRTIRLYCDVDDEFLDILETGLEALDRTTGAIIIKLKSDGGCVTTAKAAYDLIKACKNHVTIICVGEVASAATLILQAADERISLPNCDFMLHVGVESLPEDHPRNIDQLYNKHRSDETWAENIYLKRIKEKKKRFSRQKLKSLLTWDRYLTPSEFLEYGLLDEVMEEK